MNQLQKFREDLRASTGVPLLAPVIWDALSAQLAERGGLKAVWLGGSLISLAHLGVADSGVLNASDVETILRHITATSGISVLVDIDDGFGNYLNAMRTVRTMERAGAVGVQIDDQFSHRSPYQNSTLVIPEDEAVGKVKAAADTRVDKNFLIVARTDALWTLGVNGAIDRANRFIEAGAECPFITGAFTLEAMEKIHREVPAPHRQLTHLPKDMSLEKMREIGFDILALGQLDAMRLATLTVMRYYKDLNDRGLAAYHDAVKQIEGTPVEDWAGFTGLKAIKDTDRLYASPDEYERRYNMARRDPNPPPVRAT
jgi:2-methylisocitrate lyase-like PEP mutase family enzyme